MDKLIQYSTKASRYDGEFGGDAGWPAAGMGYVFVTEENRLIVVDGGHGEDAEALLHLLRELKGEETPTVDLWIVTHPHLDHYGVLREIAAKEDLRGKVNLRELLWYFPADFRDRNGKAPCDKANDRLKEVCDALGAEARVPRIGERITVDGLELTFLFVPTDCSGLTNPNSLSLIFRVKSPRKTVLMTGDACPVTMQFCVDHYGDALKSDVLQLPHHGLCDTGHGEFYRLVGADTLLIPISEAGDSAMKSGVYGEAVAANLVAEKLAKAVYPAYEGNREIEL
jgi:beta-lactamase superfamily II metal-dependent hydrolase